MFLGCSSLTKLIYTDITPDQLDLITYDGVVSPFGGCNITTIEFKNDSYVIENTDGVMVIYGDAEKKTLIRVGQNAKASVFQHLLKKFLQTHFLGIQT